MNSFPSPKTVERFPSTKLFSERVIRQIMAIRASGKYNMFDGIGVQREAHERGFHELVLLIEEHGEDYIQFILGDRMPPQVENGIRKLSGHDVGALIGTEQNSYKIIRARIKGGTFSDSDHYGIALAKSDNGCYVTWQFHIEDGLSLYWGHYHMENEEAALADYEARE